MRFFEETKSFISCIHCIYIFLWGKWNTGYVFDDDDDDDDDSGDGDVDDEDDNIILKWWVQCAV